MKWLQDIYGKKDLFGIATDINYDATKLTNKISSFYSVKWKESRLKVSLAPSRGDKYGFAKGHHK